LNYTKARIDSLMVFSLALVGMAVVAIAAEVYVMLMIH
jgi:hypothetical protein